MFKEKSMWNYIRFWKAQSHPTGCLPTLCTLMITRRLVSTTVIGTIREFLINN